jgi:hypothetical protein
MPPFLDFRLEVARSGLSLSCRLEARLHILAGLALIAGSLDQ